MFERRLKILLAILIVIVLALLARAMELQVVQRDYWRDQAAKSMRDERLLPTTRGRILDRKGQVLAHDEPCLDACVDYRIIASDQKYIAALAAVYIKSHELAQYRAANTAGRKRLIDDQTAAINEQIRKMWIKLAQLSNQPLPKIEDTRQTILDRIQLRRRMVWHSKLVHAESDKSAETKQPWYRKWLMGEQDDGPQIDDADFKIEEETSSHVILEAIDKDTQNELSKHSDDYPGLELKPAMHRVYPFGAVGCHVIGHLGRVTREDLESDGLDISDDLRGYKPADVIGRDGLEALGEPTLRGSRGEDVIDGVTDKVVSSTPPKPGDDLHSTIDIELQQEIEKMFDHVRIPYDDDHSHFDVVPMHGAAVVIEVETGNVLAMASAPGFNLNALNEEYSDLVVDRLNQPLMNRATQAMLEPGSTVKPMVGLGAITQGVLGINEGIECTGYLVIGGKKYEGFGKCWTVAVGKSHGMDFAHHPFPPDAPHRGHDGNPDGFLTYSDALERSCNVFFETTASRLGMDGLTFWLKAFGLGRPTGVGIAEVRGHLPEDYDGPNKQFATWTSGIGQGQVLATPIQMANVAATIARRGIWMRPSLVAGGEKISPFKPRGVDPNDDRWNKIPNQTDLHLSPQGLDAAFLGMKEVVNGAGGTGTTAFRNDMIVAGKTGTAQASPFFIPKSDGKDGLLRDDKGKYIMEPIIPSTHSNPNKEHPWYRATDEEGKKLNHAWFIGFAPADSPKYAVSVMIEYGGGGGGVIAGPIASQILDALIEHGYLAGNGTKHNWPTMP